MKERERDREKRGGREGERRNLCYIRACSMPSKTASRGT